MSIYDRFIKPRLLSRRRLITGGSAGLLAAAASAPGLAAPGSTNVAEGSVEDRLAIGDLIYRYGIALDSLDKAAWGACWAPGVMSAENLDKSMEYHQQYTHTMHRVMNHTYRVRGSTATGVAYCVASMVKSNSEGQLRNFDVHMMYRDELKKSNDRWAFSKRTIEIIFSTEAATVQPGAPLLELPFKPGSFRARPALQHL